MRISLSHIFKNLSRNQPAMEKKQWVNILYNAKQVNNKILLQYQDFWSAAAPVLSTGSSCFHSFFIHLVGIGKSHSLRAE